MQSVSQNWKDNQNNTLVSESDIEISLKMTDPDAYEDASAEDNGHPYFANTDYIVSDGDKVISPYATLEINQWLLDGSREIVPNSGGNGGYISNELCKVNGEYSAHPLVTVNFSTVHTNLLQGITIKWSEFLNEYATDFIVRAYNGDTVVAEKTVTGNTNLLSIVLVDIVDYDRITVEVIKWSIGYRRARIDELLIGTMKIFSKSSVFSYDCSQHIDPISAELPKAEVSFSIDNLDDSYNPYNADGLSQYLIERQEITVRYGYKLSTGYEWIKGGKFYISEWVAEQNGMTADFKARDLLEFMTNTYYKGLYNPNGTSLYDLAEDVLQDADLPINSDGSVKWVIDERLKDIYTVAPLPLDTHANCLQMIANASESVFYQDRTGTLRMESVTTKGNLCDTNNLIHFYPDGSGYIWENADIYSFVIPVQYGTVYDVTTIGRTHIRAYAYTSVYPQKRTTIWNEEGVQGKGSTWKGTFFRTTPPNENCRYLVLGFYWDNRDGNTYTLEEAILSTRVNRSIYDYSLTLSNSYSKPNLELSKPLKQVDVPFYSYTKASESSELFKGVVNITGTETLTVTYSGTATNVKATVSGGTLNSATYYSNACILDITAEGNVEITVNGYSLESSSVNIVTNSGLTGETVSVDNQLITSQDRAIAVGKWVETYMRNRMTLSSEWRADPRLDALDLVDVENDYGTNKMIMTDVKYSYKGAFRGSGEGRVV